MRRPVINPLDGSTAGLKTEGHYKMTLRSGAVERGNFKVDCLVPCRRQAASVIVKGDTLDQAGNFLGRGPAFWDCGIHVRGFISHGPFAFGHPSGGGT
jgi:hypothetical protein